MEDQSGTEGGVALAEHALRRARCTLGILTKLQSRHEIILATDCDGRRVACAISVGSAGRSRVGRVRHIWNHGKLKDGAFASLRGWARGVAAGCRKIKLEPAYTHVGNK